MNIARQIEYPNARNYFKDAETRGKKLVMGNMNTNFWLHREKINFDFVVETAKRFSDAKVFIISDGSNKGFYIYSDTREMCLKLMDISTKYAHAEIA